VDRDALGMTSMVRSAVVEFLRLWVYAHLGIPYLAPSTTSAAKIVMNNHPVTDFEGLYPWAHLDYLAAGFMSHSLELRRVSALTPGRPESSEVASAESGSAHSNDDLR
jgi:hypothetical protein